MFFQNLFLQDLLFKDLLPSRGFGAGDHPRCPHCGKDTRLTRRWPHPDHIGYEAQTFACPRCSYQLQRSADRRGNPRP
jgi:predicted RNA-binding Zn-ribbon protein involved in translation (DUF1610 family)